MSKTVEVNGKTYELGKHYWFYDCAPELGVTDILRSSKTYSYNNFECVGYDWENCVTIEEAIKNGWLTAGAITEAKTEPKAGQYWLVLSPSGMEYPLKVQDDGTFADKDVAPIRELK